jgi:putative ABC transport system permease protein
MGNTETVNPAMFAGIAVVLLIVATLASILPARRAMKVDPMTAIRCE